MDESAERMMQALWMSLPSPSDKAVDSDEDITLGPSPDDSQYETPIYTDEGSDSPSGENDNEIEPSDSAAAGVADSQFEMPAFSAQDSPGDTPAPPPEEPEEMEIRFSKFGQAAVLIEDVHGLPIWDLGSVKRWLSYGRRCKSVALVIGIFRRGKMYKTFVFTRGYPKISPGLVFLQFGLLQKIGFRMLNLEQQEAHTLHLYASNREFTKSQLRELAMQLSRLRDQP